MEDTSLARLVGSIGNRNKTCPARSDVKVNFRDTSSIDIKLCINEKDQLGTIFKRESSRVRLALGLENVIFFRGGLWLALSADNNVDIEKRSAACLLGTISNPGGHPVCDKCYESFWRCATAITREADGSW